MLSVYRIPIPNGQLIRKNEPITAKPPIVLKSQVPTGGRGKAGGIVVVKDSEDIPNNISRLFTLSIKNHTPKTLLAEELISIDRELYISLLIDREAAAIKLMAHIEGGVEVEDNDPDSFFSTNVTISNSESVGESLAEYYGLESKSFALQDLVKNLYACFIQNDATLIEINPLILDSNGQLIAGDCKMTLDDVAQFRHPDWNFETASAETNFVELDTNGTVATIANGAGLAMATVDTVTAAGLKPANFLDIGGGANEASVYAAFERIMAYKSVRAIVINIFAGITRCDEVARAIIAARNRLDNLPRLYIRLAGTNYDEAARLLSEQGVVLLPTLEAGIKAALKDIRS